MYHNEIFSNFDGQVKNLGLANRVELNDFATFGSSLMGSHKTVPQSTFPNFVIKPMYPSLNVLTDSVEYITLRSPVQSGKM